MSHTSCKSRNAFTLIELLVVIAIIAILAAILFPVFAKARAAARDTSTVSNVRSVMMAANMYADDYDEATVPWEIYEGAPNQDGNLYRPWPVLVQPYMKSTNICFDTARETPFVTVDASNRWGWTTTLSINRYGFSNLKFGGAGLMTLAAMQVPASRMAFIVGRDPVGTASANPNGNWTAMHWMDGARSACPNKANLDTASYDYNGLYKAAKDYHGGQYIVAYADGHAGKVPADRMSGANSYGACEGRYFFPYGGAPAAADAEDSKRLNDFWGQWWADN